ncbi:MAG: ATP-binding protein [Bellilinea sp.]|jgi:PAS domain S-box-containing protein
MRDVISRPIQALFGGKNGKVDIAAALRNTLEMIEDAALIYDPEQNRVLTANSSFLILSSYALQEIVHSRLEDLFDALSTEALNRDGNSIATLRTRNRSNLPVDIRKTILDTQSNWWIIRVCANSESHYRRSEWHQALLAAFSELPDLIQIPVSDLKAVIRRILKIINNLFETHLVCVYHANAQLPELTKLITLEELAFFPDSLPSTDLIRASTSSLWYPGKRMVSHLHRSARIAGLSYVATIPIGKENAFDGLLIIGGMDQPPPPYLLETGQALGVYISKVLTRAILEENEKKEALYRNYLTHVYLTVYEFVQEGVLVVNSDSMVVEMNPAAELLLGYTRKEVQGEHIENILITPDRLMPNFAGVLAGSAASGLENITLHRRNGQNFSADVKVLPIRQDNRLVGVIVLIHDISEHEQILAQSRQLEQRAFLGEFMGVFAHEVLNPINNISTGLQILSRRIGAESQYQDTIARMENDCVRLHHQMEALKSYAKPYEPQQEAVDIPGLLKRILDRWRPRMERSNITHVFQPAENLPPVKGDWRALDQVFNNLISNAIDVMREKGGILSVRVALSTLVTNRPHLEIAVSDNGPGIPDDIRERIFEPFVTTKSSGTGLGLSITKRIVTAHRGSITFNSYPGGTIFRVFLPACEE